MDVVTFLPIQSGKYIYNGAGISMNDTPPLFYRETKVKISGIAAALWGMF
jgi:hypothetical protein